MDASESSPAEGQRSDGRSEEQQQEFIGFRTSKALKKRVRRVALARSDLDRQVSMSEVAREALARGLDEIEDGGE
jgi:hypothetical protein